LRDPPGKGIYKLLTPGRRGFVIIQPQIQEPRELAPARAGKRNRMKQIFVVEDEKDLVELLTYNLEKDG